MTGTAAVIETAVTTGTAATAGTAATTGTAATAGTAIITGTAAIAGTGAAGGGAAAVGIAAYGAYIPRYRLGADTAGWGSRQQRAVANFDEDSVTMAVAAGADALAGRDREGIDGIIFASTTPPYAEKQSAAIVAAALDLRADIFAADIGNTLRAGTTALKAALDAVGAGSARQVLVVIADSRQGPPRGDTERNAGDGAAAFIIASGSTGGGASGSASGIAAGGASGITSGIAGGGASGITSGIAGGGASGITSGIAGGGASGSASGIAGGGASSSASGIAGGGASGIASAITTGGASGGTSGIAGGGASDSDGVNDGGDDGGGGGVPIIARLDGAHSVTDNMLDSWRAPGDAFVRSWEDRFAAEEGIERIVPGAVSGYMERTGYAPGDIAKAAVYAPDARRHARLCQALGLAPAQVSVSESLFGSVGSAGAALTPLLLAAALESARPGELLLSVSYGDGSDVIGWRVTPAIVGAPGPAMGVAGGVKSGRILGSYETYARWRDVWTLDDAARRPAPASPSASALWREGDKNVRLYGGRCRQCGYVQYPAQRVCVECRAVDEGEAVRLSDAPGRVFTYSMDYIAGAVDTPLVVAVVDFEGGGRMLCMLTDREPAEVRVGMGVEMSFRRLRTVNGISNYYWKAAPRRAASDD